MFRQKANRPEATEVWDANRLSDFGQLWIITGLLGWAGLQLLWHFRPGMFAGQWTGLPVYLYTASKLMIPGVSIVVLTQSLQPKARHKALLGIAALPFLYYVMLLGRRSWMIMGGFCFLMPLVMTGKIKIRQKSLLILCVMAPFAFVLVPAYRHQFAAGAEQTIEAMTRRPPSVVIAEYINGEQTLELEGAIKMFSSSRSTATYYYGGDLWDGMVHKLLPGSIVGHNLKNSLYLGSRKHANYQAEVTNLRRTFRGDADVPSYTAKPSFTDSFTNFGWFGVFAYYILGLVFGRIGTLAFEFGDHRAVLAFLFFGFFPAALCYGRWSFILPVFSPVLLMYFVTCRFVFKKPLTFFFTRPLTPTQTLLNQ
ncbi:hypothetical protein LOC71_01205 [Rhodopirellula sp. JC740]|uniref:Uncharacterized protein n=1 Tax=Rhodopirellula halodulae TaxID=2894198 RepID=A0ABS8NBE5_9BACT|nr:hypothetical protein [Rhodopirellula sp. JC740]MCC9640874.1 hypothetical protein [Rhodopirellula sp. JC740]